MEKNGASLAIPGYDMNRGRFAHFFESACALVRGIWTALAAGAVLVALAGPGFAARTYPTPEIDAIERIDARGEVAYVMRGELGDSGSHVGLALVCEVPGPDRIEVTAFFGSFLADRRRVQLAVRGAQGAAERFGPMVSGGPESGFHSPRLTDREDVRRFVAIALRPGSLISNGYRSFWNRASEARNRTVREDFLACLARR